MRRKAEVPNIYIGIHYQELSTKYGLVANVNVFIGKGFYKKLKKDILTINYQNPERDLLLRQSRNITLRFLLQNVYPKPEYKGITKQIQHLYKQNPKLFDQVLLRSKVDRFAKAQEAKLDSKEAFYTAGFTYIMLGQQLVRYQVQNYLNLPTKYS